MIELTCFPSSLSPKITYNALTAALHHYSSIALTTITSQLQHAYSYLMAVRKQETKREWQQHPDRPTLSQCESLEIRPPTFLYSINLVDPYIWRLERSVGMRANKALGRKEVGGRRKGNLPIPIFAVGIALGVKKAQIVVDVCRYTILLLLSTY